MKRLVLLLILISTVYGKDIRIIAPYYGSINNQLAVENMEDLEDSAPIAGLYFQWVNPERYQWNVFLYQSSNINESDITGSHFIFDFYLGNCPNGKYVIGAGLDIIKIKTDGNISPALQNFKMTNNIYAPFIRAGRYLNFGSEMKKFTILPWIGYEQDIIHGDLGFTVPSMSPQMPPMTIDKEIDDDYHYALTGINFKTTLYHFIELSMKYYRKFSLDDGEDLNTLSGMANIYLNRHWGLSYRYKYMEVSVSKNTYHIGGVEFVF
jgi:hypothetical protein